MILVRNNIEFRKASSIAVAKFKQHEHFVLSEITEGRIEFNRTSREIMLLKFRLWSRWIADIEDIIAFLPGNELKQNDIDNMIYTMESVDNRYTTTILENTHLFEKKQSNCWIEVHKGVAYAYLDGEVKSTVGMSKVEAFNVIISAIIEAMLMGLYELWEISLIRNGDLDNKLAYTNLSHEYQTKGKGCALLFRANLYNKYYNVSDFKIENYSSDEVFISVEAVNDFAEAGFTLEYKSKKQKSKNKNKKKQD